MPKTRVAIAGLGRAAKAIHIPALRKLPDVSVIGGYDPVPEPAHEPSKRPSHG
jgi:predicted dehydrogenase